jgi:glycosyltransferase involved in cell wall biosynthesis
MRIVHLSTSDTSGGAARAAFRVHSGLVRLGHDSRMFVSTRFSRDPAVDRFFPSKDLVSKIRRRVRRRSIVRDFAPYEGGLPEHHELFSDDRTEHGIDMARQVPACDLVNLHWVAGFLDHVSFFEYFARERPAVPIVWRLADMAPLTGGCHYDQGCGRFTARCGACPELGSSDENDLSRQVWLRKDRALRALQPGRMHLVATSRWIAGEAKRSSLLGRFPVTIIPNGLDPDVFRPLDKHFSRDVLNIPRDVPVVLFAADSAAQRRKGFRELAEAVEGISGIDDVTLVSVGGGNAELKSGHRHVHIGRLSDDRLLAMAYSAADVFVISSLQESFGQTVIESMACGTPVVGFASGGIPDMVRPGQTGYLAPTGDTAGLREGIVKLLRDPQARAEMSQHCRRIVLEEYSLDVQARQYVRLYESLLAQQSIGEDSPVRGTTLATVSAGTNPATSR